MRKERKIERGHLSLKFKLSDEIAKGLYPDLTKDLIHIKEMKEKGHLVLPDNESLNKKSINKLKAFNVLRKLDCDLWEVLIVFNMINNKYAELLQ
jgi:hypothetical protein